MVDIPEHLLQRSKERRKALGLPVPGEEGGEAEAPAAEAPAADAPAAEAAGAAEAPAAAASAPAEDVTTESGTKIPAHLLERAKRRKAAAAGGGDVAAAGTGGAAAATATLPAPTTTGPGGHTQRLLTVVKSGSIQQTRAEAQDKVHTWPHLLVIEFASILIVLGRGHHLLGAGARTAARSRRLQQDAQPVEGAVVLPRVAGTAHDVPPDGRGCDHPGHRAVPAHGGAVRRQEPVQQAQGPEVRDRDLHAVPGACGRCSSSSVRSSGVRGSTSSSPGTTASSSSCRSWKSWVSPSPSSPSWPSRSSASS